MLVILSKSALCVYGILRERRQILRLTQKEVADRAGIGLQHYQKFETEARKLNKASFDVACRVLEALEMNIADYFHGKYAVGEEVFFDQDGKER